ncbi:MAG: UDP-N-acetylglucosamine pyrophosphorylase [Lachnospiraceae bacterium]|nr:UDP-N-acetylglucosamine pyrophosphorylase [Candidatus Equihabitans merdae]
MKAESAKIIDLFDLNETIAADYLRSFTYPWEALGGIRELIDTIGPTLPKEIYEQKGEHIWIAKSADVFPSAYIGDHCIIGENTQVRHCAFVRGDALVGNDCVVGNSVELKNVIIFNNSEVPHYNYVGDSILGFHAHMGAGSITSNIRSDRKNIIVHGTEDYVTNRRKIGAIIGDYAEIGCNAVLNPGTVLGRRSMVYPTSCVRGIVPEDTIFTNDGRKLEKK